MDTHFCLNPEYMSKSIDTKSIKKEKRKTFCICSDDSKFVTRNKVWYTLCFPSAYYITYTIMCTVTNDD